MSTYLFEEFESVSETAWKQKIQVDLKGADYNDTLLWKTNEGITVKPFYTKADRTNSNTQSPKKGFSICQSIFVDDVQIANSLAKEAIKKGTDSIEFVAKNSFDYKLLFNGIDVVKNRIYIKCEFLDVDFIQNLIKEYHTENIFLNIDIVGNLAKTGNWFTNLKADFDAVKKYLHEGKNTLAVNGSIYQNAGANIVQQLAYTLAHANEYLNSFGKEAVSKIHFNFAIGSNYFFEIAKLRAFRILWNALLDEYEITNKPETHIFSSPSLRNKTIYDYNVNMLRTTSESMSAILGGSNTVSNISYDTVFHKSNEFGERISRNQLLILQQESYLKEAQNIADGTYYIENITQQLAEKALEIFKQIEKGGGFLAQLKDGTIQRKIDESAQKEQELFDSGKLTLLGTNKLPNPNDKMKNDIELYPFIKINKTKTLIPPILAKRLSSSYEKERLDNE